MSLARDYIEITELWENTDKGFVIDNLERLAGYRIKGNNKTIKPDELARITNVTSHAVIAWFNRSRENVKIPLLKLCVLADYFNVDIRDFLTVKLTCSRDWNGMLAAYSIDSRQYAMFTTINEADFFENGAWDIKKLAEYIDGIEDYSSTFDRPMQLVKDCRQYMSCVMDIKDGKYLEEVEEQVIYYLNRK